ncbi:hypothetical protein ACOMHN_062097 [Nucella lapillus]
MNTTGDGFPPENTSPASMTDGTLFPEHQAEMIILKIFPPCILLVGTFGNIATVCVMRRIKDHNSSQHAILMTLAVSDFLLIQTGMLRRLFFYYFQIDVRMWHVVVCKLYNWLIYVTTNLSAWLVTCVTLQRTMAVTWPHKMRMVCTLRRTWIVVALIVLVACTVHVHFLVGMEITSGGRCTYGTPDYRHFCEIVWTWVDLFMSSFLPSLCLIVCDVILSLALFKAASGNMQTRSDANATRERASRKKTASSTTVMCLALSCTFLILTLPICIDLVWNNYVYVTLNQTPRLKAQKSLAKSVLSLLWYSNSAVNFFLYCITGTRFRQEFVSWMCCRAQGQTVASVSHASAEGVQGRKGKERY